VQTTLDWPVTDFRPAESPLVGAKVARPPRKNADVAASQALRLAAKARQIAISGCLQPSFLGFSTSFSTVVEISRGAKVGS
jgi:hypothetical protein